MMFFRIPLVQFLDMEGMTVVFLIIDNNVFSFTELKMRRRFK
jgi:hypothetical protein